MRYPASEKLAIIRIVERSHSPVKHILDRFGIARPTFYLQYGSYLRFGTAALKDKLPGPKRGWNRIPDKARGVIFVMALERTELLPRELSATFTDTKRYFVSQASVYRLLKAYDLITSLALIAMKAGSEFKDKTTAINQLWQTDFTYLKIIGWGWYYLSTILDDYSRYIIAWKLCTTMRAEDVTDTPELALAASGCNQVHVLHQPRLLSDNGPSYGAGELADYLADKKLRHVRGASFHPQTQFRTLSIKARR